MGEYDGAVVGVIVGAPVGNLVGEAVGSIVPINGPPSGHLSDPHVALHRKVLSQKIDDL